MRRRAALPVGEFAGEVEVRALEQLGLGEHRGEARVVVGHQAQVRQLAPLDAPPSRRTVARHRAPAGPAVSWFRLGTRGPRARARPRARGRARGQARSRPRGVRVGPKRRPEATRCPPLGGTPRHQGSARPSHWRRRRRRPCWQRPGGSQNSGRSGRSGPSRRRGQTWTTGTSAAPRRRPWRPLKRPARRLPQAAPLGQAAPQWARGPAAGKGRRGPGRGARRRRPPRRSGPGA
mmetsp:Transcript_31908/g.71861  ORF Transcript_31908/g.71861 Transcript_31908/m.71861 type:complete len:234 (-) Transcript_31908:1277-1978(-)